MVREGGAAAPAIPSLRLEDHVAVQPPLDQGFSLMSAIGTKQI